MRFLFASGNRHKAGEICAIFADAELHAEIEIPARLGLSFDPVEDGADFAENALIKARALHRLVTGTPGQSGTVILADDSGLCVDALDGRPGIYSARYGEHGGGKLSDGERNALLLKELAAAGADADAGAARTARFVCAASGGKADMPRTARFVCAAAALLDKNRYIIVMETLEGEIALECRGQNGFGYDPLFFLPDQGCTLAELGEAEKNRISHRGKAFRALAGFFR